MLSIGSFLLQNLSGRPPPSGQHHDTSTDGESAHVYAGDASSVPVNTTRLRTISTAKHLDGRVFYGRLFSLELPETNCMRIDANLTQGTSCLPPSKMVGQPAKRSGVNRNRCSTFVNPQAQAVSKAISDSKTTDVFKREELRCLRNVAFPPDLNEKNLPTFDNDSDLGKVLPAMRNRSLAFSLLCNGAWTSLYYIESITLILSHATIGYALRGRFHGLAVHKVCYYQAYDTAEVAQQKLERELELSSEIASRPGAGSREYPHQDCLGMTPLHILACSTKQRSEMYRIMVKCNPEYLFIQDKWGARPFLYLIWGRAPKEIVQLVANAMKIHPPVEDDWESDLYYSIVATFARAAAPLVCYEYAIEMAKLFDLNDERRYPFWASSWRHAVETLCVESHASREYVEGFIQIFRTSFPKTKLDLELLSVTLVRREKFCFKPFWFEIGVGDRISKLHNQTWRIELGRTIQTFPSQSSERDHQQRVDIMNRVLTKLAEYESIQRLWVVELAFWKHRIHDESDEKIDNVCERDFREWCRVTSGSDIVLPCVMSYLHVDYNFTRAPTGRQG